MIEGFFLIHKGTYTLHRIVLQNKIENVPTCGTFFTFQIIHLPYHDNDGKYHGMLVGGL